MSRFPKASGFDIQALAAVIKDKPQLSGITVITNPSFGHTTPQFTFPIGDHGILTAERGMVQFTIPDHESG